MPCWPPTPTPARSSTAWPTRWAPPSRASARWPTTPTGPSTPRPRPTSSASIQRFGAAATKLDEVLTAIKPLAADLGAAPKSSPTTKFGVLLSHLSRVTYDLSLLTTKMEDGKGGLNPDGTLQKLILSSALHDDLQQAAISARAVFQETRGRHAELQRLRRPHRPRPLGPDPRRPDQALKGAMTPRPRPFADSNGLNTARGLLKCMGPDGEREYQRILLSRVLGHRVHPATCSMSPGIVTMSEWAEAGSNRRHRHFQCRALPAELSAPVASRSRR